MTDKRIEIGKEKYRRNVNKEDYTKGVNAVTVAPGTTAAANKDKFSRNTSNKEAELIAGLQGVDESARKKANIDAIPKQIQKCVNAVNSGKYDAALILAAGKESSAECAKMANSTLDDSYERMMKNQEIQKKKHGVI
jgi:hypothetical protein